MPPIIDIIIIAVAVGIVVGAVVLAIRNKKKGKTSCGYDCSKCASCASCKHYEDYLKERNKK